MGTRRLTALAKELRSLDQMRFLSTREKRRRETVVRQIEVEKLRLEALFRRRNERRERKQRVLEYRQERRVRRLLNRKRHRQEVVEQTDPKPAKVKRYRCKMCGRPMRGKRRFCGKVCRKAARNVPSPSRIRAECDNIIARWDAVEEATRSGRIGGAKWRLAAEFIERYAYRQPAHKPSAESHDRIFHGARTNRADSDYWNQ